jgi:DNA excision repair protein ERCC-3
MSVGLETNDIIQVLGRLSKIPLPPRLQNRIADWTSSYGKIRLVLKNNKYFLESTNEQFLVKLLNDPIIANCKVDRTDEDAGGGQQVHGLEKGSGPDRGLIIPGTEAARRAERGEVDQNEGRGRQRDDVIGAVIGLDRSEPALMRVGTRADVQPMRWRMMRRPGRSRSQETKWR